jgi:hypothetical protein
MSEGDVVRFDELTIALGYKVHNLNNDTFKLALIDSVQTPVASSADPRWGAGGTVNFDTNEVSAGGNYVAEGTDIVNTYTESGGVSTFDGIDISWAVHGSNPTDARWGIIYNSTSAGKECIAFVDLGAIFDMTGGDLDVNWNAGGIFTLT